MATRAPKPPANWTPANSIDTSTCKSIQCSVTYQWHHNKAKQTITNKPPLAYTVLKCAIYGLRHLHLHLPTIQRNISCCLLKKLISSSIQHEWYQGITSPLHSLHNSLKKNTGLRLQVSTKKCGGSVSLANVLLGHPDNSSAMKDCRSWGLRDCLTLRTARLAIWKSYMLGRGFYLPLTLDKRSFTMQVLNWQAKKGVKRNMLSSNAWCSNAFCSLGQWEVDPKRDIQINLGNSTRHKPIIHLTKAKECYVCFWALRLFSCHVGSHTLNSHRS